MTFELFGPAKREDIRVAYVSPDLGLVEGVTICDANAYAKLNPGTIFIFKRRDKIQYLVVDDLPTNVKSPKKGWHENHARDQHQRNSIERGY